MDVPGGDTSTGNGPFANAILIHELLHVAIDPSRGHPAIAQMLGLPSSASSSDITEELLKCWK
jgi:hypothetical protein